MKCKLINDNFTSDYGANLLRARGIQDVNKYINPTSEYLKSPEDLCNIAEGAQLYLSNIGDNKRILIIVDSDNDGFTSATIMYQYTAKIAPTTQIDYWLHEGKQHGLQDHIDKLINLGHVYDLIILPDSSSNDFEYHERLKSVNTPCLVLDHHLTDIPISNNAIVINNQLSDNYSNKELTGAGVAYQFCRYIDILNHTNWADDYLDLAAWGVVGDMSSVLELENRYIICEGLKNIKNKFLLALMDKQGYSITGTVAPSTEELIEAMNPISIAFYIVPLVNATIRVGTMDEKKRLFEAFIDGDKLVPSGKRGAKGSLEKASVEAARECTNARARQNRIKEAAVEQLEQKILKYNLLENKILIVRLTEESIPPELTGLIAMQLCAKYKKPTIVARLNAEGFDRGSARGMNQSEMNDFKKFLTDSGMVEYAQGHANAFGVSIPDDNLRKFHEYANEVLKNIDFGENCYDVNFQRGAAADDLQLLIKDLARFDGIWGQLSPEPLIHITDLNIKRNDIVVIGKNKDTIKFEKYGITYIKFHAKELIEQIESLCGDVKFEIVGKPNLNEWMGRITPQILIEDVEFKKDLLTDF